MTGAPAGHRSHSGLVTLEWLLIVGAVAGLAASSVLVVQQVVDDTSEVSVDPYVRMLEAEVEAAFIANEADAAALAGTTVFSDYEQRCQTALKDDYDDVLDLTATWTSPTTVPAVLAPNPNPSPAKVSHQSRCKVTVRP